MNTVNCPNCGVQVMPGAAFCDNCGTSMAGVAARPGAGPAAAPPGPAAGLQRCPSCGEGIMPGEAFCGNCGTPLTTAAPTVYTPPPSAPSPGWPPPPAPSASSWTPPPASSSPSWSPPPPPAPSAPSWSPPSPPAPQGWGAPPAPSPAGATCPNCNAPIEPSDVFCDNCGQVLAPASGFPASPQIPAPAATSTFESDPVMPIVRPEPPAPVVPVGNPRLIVKASGATLNLAPGKSEYLIGREDPVSGSFPDVDLVPYGGEEGGVSRRHAQIIRRGTQFSIEDLNSVNYTFVNRQKVVPGTSQPLQDGDEVRLGRVVLQFKTS